LNLVKEIRFAWHLLYKPIRGTTHQERLECFYRGQAVEYDRRRQNMLHGREDLYRDLLPPLNGIWLDMGGGTGGNLEPVDDRLPSLRKVYIVDLSSSMLDVARRRIAERNWKNVSVIQADMAEFVPPEGPVDLVTFSYSLTMTPNWFDAITHAFDLLRPGGLIGVADYYVSQKFPTPGMCRHNAWTRTFWPMWFGMRNVHPSPDHLPCLQQHFEQVTLQEGTSPVALMPGFRIPFYRFIGRKSLHSRTSPVLSS